MQPSPRRQRRGAGCCWTRRMRSPRPPWTSPPTPTRGRSPWRRSGCPRSFVTAGTTPGGTSTRQWTSGSPRVAAPAKISRCSALAPSSLRRDGRRRWRSSRKKPAVARYVEIGLEHAVPGGRGARASAPRPWHVGVRLPTHRVHRRRRRDGARGERGGIRPRGSTRTGRSRKRSARRRREHRFHRWPARADVTR